MLVGILLSLLPALANAITIYIVFRHWQKAEDEAYRNLMAVRALLEYVKHDGLVRRIGTDGIVARKYEVVPRRVIVAVDKAGRMVEVEIIGEPDPDSEFDDQQLDI